jgi:DNA primase
VLACHQAGIRDAVAVMGTAITPEQVKLLSAYAEEAVLALDADRAGREAMLRAQGVASGKRLRLRVARMPDGKDPADLLAGGDAGAAAAFRDAIEAAEDLPVFHARMLLDDADLSSPAGRDRALDEVVGVISAMPDSITREELIREVGERLGADPGLVTRRIASSGRPARSAPAVAVAPQEPERPLSARELREEGLLALIVGSPGDGRDWLDKLQDDHFSTPTAVRAFHWIREHLEEPTRGLSHDDDALLSYVTKVTMLAEREPATPEAMELSYLELELARLDDRIQAAEGNGREPPVELQRNRAALTERIARAHS